MLDFLYPWVLPLFRDVGLLSHIRGILGFDSPLGIVFYGPLVWSVVFLFNGAEEVWAPFVRSCITVPHWWCKDSLPGESYVVPFWVVIHNPQEENRS